MRGMGRLLVLRSRLVPLPGGGLGVVGEGKRRERKVKAVSLKSRSIVLFWGYILGCF
jgi:hypothetical protein